MRQTVQRRSIAGFGRSSGVSAAASSTAGAQGSMVVVQEYPEEAYGVVSGSDE